VKATDAYARLRKLGVPAISTADAASVLGRDTDGANKTLRRLAASGLVAPVCRGLWSLAPMIDPLLLPDFLTAPWPSYVSLQTALYHHGLIEQIPAVVYAVSLDRTRRIRTRFGTFSIHRVAPEVFGGFDVGDAGMKLARPEKALFDVFYLSATRSRQFAALPELELPRAFDRRALDGWTRKITSPVLAKIVQRRIAETLGRRR
jgi:predicted transcriptional regulator of viral defense system